MNAKTRRAVKRGTLLTPAMKKDLGPITLQYINSVKGSVVLNIESKHDTTPITLDNLRSAAHNPAFSRVTCLFSGLGFYWRTSGAEALPWKDVVDVLCEDGAFPSLKEAYIDGDIDEYEEVHEYTQSKRPGLFVLAE